MSVCLAWHRPRDTVAGSCDNPTCVRFLAFQVVPLFYEPGDLRFLGLKISCRTGDETQQKGTCLHVQGPGFHSQHSKEKKKSYDIWAVSEPMVRILGQAFLEYLLIM